MICVDFAETLCWPVLAAFANPKLFDSYGSVGGGGGGGLAPPPPPPPPPPARPSSVYACHQRVWAIIIGPSNHQLGLGSYASN